MPFIKFMSCCLLTMKRNLFKLRTETAENANLADLPVEILLIIFQYLDPIFLVHTISLVCKRFTTILLDDDYWKLIYFRELKGYQTFEEVPILGPYGLLRDTWRCEPDVHWRDLTVRLKKIHNRWNAPQNVLKFHSSTETVDAVHILKDDNICITGSRERCIDLWGIELQPYIKSTVVDAHRGWVTCLASYEKGYFLSGAWDSAITYWSIEQSICHPVWSFDCGRAVMALAGKRGLVAAGIFSPSVILIDPRIQENHRSSRFVVHDKSIVSIAFWENCIVSVGRDQKLCAFDLRKLSVVHKVQACRTGAVPRCLAVRDNIVYVGDSKGYVHLFDANSEFEKFQQIAITARNYQVASVCPDLGNFAVGCTDHALKIIVPSKPTYEVQVVDVDHEITSMSYENQMLAVGKTNGAINVFKPS